MLALSREIISSVVVGRFVVAVSFVRDVWRPQPTRRLRVWTLVLWRDSEAGFARDGVWRKEILELLNGGGSWMLLLGQESCALFFCTVPSGGDGMRF